MDQRPEQPPEGRLIAAAAAHLDLSIREAARRAGISYGRWRQVVSGVQNVSPGSYAKVHAPAKTLARMAAVVGVTPDQMEAAGRPDAAGIMRQDAPPAPPPRREIDFSGNDPEGLHPYRQQVLREIYEAAGFAAALGPGEVPEPDAFPGLERTLALLPPARQPFRAADYEAQTWDLEGMTLNERVTLIARIRLHWDQASGSRRRQTGLASSLVSVAPEAFRASS